MKKLILTWQNKENRKWFPIGQLTFDGSLYKFVYVHGAEIARNEGNFQAILSFPDFNKIYESVELFPMFANRVMPNSRADFEQIIGWLNLEKSNFEPISFLSNSGGARITDSFEMFCCPEKDDEGFYNFLFFAHGLRYLPKYAIERINQLSKHDELLLALDFQNPFETKSRALILRTVDNHIVGYCPTYLLEDAKFLIENCELCEVYVEKVNDELSPTQFRLLCRLKSCWANGFEPFTSDIFKTLDSKEILEASPVFA
jgi:hypothetical protein